MPLLANVDGTSDLLRCIRIIDFTSLLVNLNSGSMS